MTTETEILTKNETALATKRDYTKYTGESGREDLTQEDYTLPFLQILQDLSPTVKTGENESGQIFQSASKEVFDGADGITFVPVKVSREYIEWIPRKRGGGLVGRHTPSSAVVAAAKKQRQELGHQWNEYYVGDGDDPNVRNDLIETGSILGLLVREDGSTAKVVISCKATHMKAYKSLNTMCGDLQGDPALFAIRLKLTTVEEPYSAGSSYNWNIQFDGDNYIMKSDDPLFQKAADFYETIVSGNVKIDLEGEAKATSNSDEDDTPF